MKAPHRLALAALLLSAPAVLALHFRDGPPARVTGGFGEDSCHACHSGHALNDAGGRLTLTGFPERFTPGEVYEIELALERPKTGAAGFQLAVRHAGERTQAGRIDVSADSEARVGLLEERGVQFAHQRRPEAAGPDAGVVRWTLTWTAPDAAERVHVHAAAVAGDGDDSQLGDYVYTLESAAVPDRQ